MTYLGTANYSAGVTMGKTMMEVLGGKGKVGVASVPGRFNLEERSRGIKDAFRCDQWRDGVGDGS